MTYVDQSASAAQQPAAEVFVLYAPEKGFGLLAKEVARQCERAAPDEKGDAFDPVKDEAECPKQCDAREEPFEV